MAGDLNRVMLIGRLTRDPEMKSTSSGSYFCRFSLASNRQVPRKDSETKEEVGYFDCVAWGKLAEIITKYATKGKRLGIDGSLRYSNWESPDGQKRSKVEIFVENFQFLDGGPRASEGDSARQEPSAPFADFAADAPFGDEDIPF